MSNLSVMATASAKSSNFLSIIINYTVIIELAPCLKKGGLHSAPLSLSPGEMELERACKL